MSDSGAPGPQPPVTPIDLVLPGAWRGRGPEHLRPACAEGRAGDGRAAEGRAAGGTAERRAAGGTGTPLAPLTPVVGRTARPNDTLELPFGVVAPPLAARDPLTRTGDGATEPAPARSVARMIDLTALEERTVQPAVTASHVPAAATSGPGSGAMGGERSGRAAGGDDTPFWLQDVKPPLIREPSPVLGVPRTAGPTAEPVEPVVAPADAPVVEVADEALAEPNDEPVAGATDEPVAGQADERSAATTAEDTADLLRPGGRDRAQDEPEEPLAPVARPFVPPITPVLHPVTPAVPFPAPVAATPVEGVTPIPDPHTAGRPVAEPLTPVPAVPALPDPTPAGPHPTPAGQALSAGALHLPLAAPLPGAHAASTTRSAPPSGAAPAASPARPVPPPEHAPATSRPHRGSWANEAPTEAIAVVSGAAVPGAAVPGAVVPGGAPPRRPGRRRAPGGRGSGPRRVSAGGVAGVVGLLVLVSGIALPFVLTGLPDGADSVSLTAPSVAPSPLAASATPSSGVTSASPDGSGSPDDAAPPTTVADSSTTRKKRTRSATSEPRTRTSTATRTSSRPRTTRTTREPTPTPTPSTSEVRPGQVFVDDPQYVGRPREEARNALAALGLVVYDDWDFAPGTPAGIVVNVRPDGWVPVGSVVWIEISRG